MSGGTEKPVVGRYPSPFGSYCVSSSSAASSGS